jgi:hypothetical protein
VAVELDAVVENLEPPRHGTARTGTSRARCRRRLWDVENPATRDTREVIVQLGVAVEPKPGRLRPLAHESLRREQAQISIHGGEADARKTAAHPRVDRGRRWMRVGGADGLEDRVSGTRQPKATGAEHRGGRQIPDGAP